MPDDPATPSPVTAGAAPWWTSKQFDGLLATFVIALFGVGSHWIPKLATITYTQVMGWIGDATSIIVAGGALVALVQRQRSKLNPLTLSKQGAAEHPATIAVMQTQQAMAGAGIPTAVTLQKAIEAASIVKPPETSP